MSKIKSVSQFEDNIWGEATPIGADASNIDVEMSDSSTKDLQTVLGDIPSAAAPIQSQINTKVTASGGNIGNTTVSSGIQNFDSSSSETSTELLDTSVRVTNATEVTSSMWTKFNRFRKRVDNKFKDVFLSSVEDVASPSLTKTYSQSALNDYFANVVGYATAVDLPDASSTIASQLSTLNGSAIKNITRSGTTFTATRIDETTFTFTQQDSVGLTYKTYAAQTLTNQSVGGSSVKAATATFTQAGTGDLMVPTNLQIAQATSGGSTYAYISLAGWYSNPSSHTFTVVLTNRSSSSATCNVAIGLSILH